MILLRKDINKINRKLWESYVVELSRPNINKFERAEIILKIMADQKLSLRGFCDKFHLKAGTVSGWLKWAELGKEKYDKLKNQGMSESDITRMLKSENMTTEGQFLTLIKTLNSFIDRNKIKYDGIIIEEIRMLRNKFNSILYKNKGDML